MSLGVLSAFKRATSSRSSATSSLVAESPESPLCMFLIIGMQISSIIAPHANAGRYASNVSKVDLFQLDGAPGNRARGYV